MSCHKWLPTTILLLCGVTSAREVVIIEEMANIRAGASMHARVLAIACINTTLDADRSSGRWTLVRAPDMGITGYIYSPLIREATHLPKPTAIGAQPSPARIVRAPEPSIATEEFRWLASRGAAVENMPRATVRAESAEIREHNDAASHLVARVGRGCQLVHYTQDDATEWSHVGFRDLPVDGWILTRDLEHIVPLEQTSSAPPTTALADARDRAEAYARMAAYAQQQAQEAKEATQQLREEMLMALTTAEAQKAQLATVRTLEQNERSDFDSLFGFDIGSGDPGNGTTGAAYRGRVEVAWKRPTGLVLQFGGVAEKNAILRQYGASGGLGWERAGLGVFGFLDALQYQLEPGTMTFHIQARPVVRFRSADPGSISLAVYAGLPLTGEQLAHSSITQNFRAEPDGIHEITTTTTVYDDALAHVGGEIRGDLRDRALFAVRTELAEHTVYRLALSAELRMIERWHLTAEYDRTHYGDYYPLAGHQGWDTGWTFRFGIAYRDSWIDRRAPESQPGTYASGRLLVPSDYPLVVQKVNSSSTDIIVAENLSVYATATPPTGQAPLDSTLEAFVSGGKAPFRYSWDLGDGAGDAGKQVSHTYATRGHYIATVTVHDALGDSAAARTTVDATEGPIYLSCAASATTVEPGTTVQFSVHPRGGIGRYTYAWDFGDGGTSDEQNPQHAYTKPGTYTAVVAVTSGSDSATCDQTIHVDENPGLQVNCSASVTTGPAPLDVTFDASATGGTKPYTYHWTFGDGSSAASHHAVHTYLTPATYTAVVTVTDSNGNTAQCDQIITVTDGPQPLTLECSASAHAVIAPERVQFFATVSGGTGPYTFRWTFSDGGTSTEQNPMHQYDCAPGTYKATCVVTTADHTAECEETVTVELPQISLNCHAQPDSGTAPLAVQFSVKVSGTYDEHDITFYWEFDDGEWSDQESPTHVYTAPGTYNASVIVATGCESEVCELTITVN